MYEFSNTWFDVNAKNVWTKLISEETPQRVLEIGSFEGASACFIIDNAQHKKIELHCIDPWDEGEHFPKRSEYSQMQLVESKFRHNTDLARKNSSADVDFHVHKGLSTDIMAKLLSQGYRNYFDWVYIDGSHRAPDVLADAVLAFLLTRPGGILIFDDYTWRYSASGSPDVIECPKIAIDAFVNIYFKEVKVIPKWMRQIYVRKL
jgi:predicted O-methyltransferase YrrM